MTHQELLDILEWDPTINRFRWKVATGSRSAAGQIAGSKSGNGYRQIQINGSREYEHRLVWFYHYGVWPTKLLDHMDKNPLNNSLDNLRECTHIENKQNIDPYKSNKTGIIGVSWDKARQKWFVRITVNKQSINLGRFDNFDDAVKARQEAEIKYHPFRIKT